MLYVFTVSLILIALGELADKSQLLALGLAARHRVWEVLLGVAAGTLVVSIVSTAFGQFAGGLIPDGILPWISGGLFIALGLWTLRGDEDASESEIVGGRAAAFGPVFTVAVAFFIAEMGDKTQLMTVAIAADPGGALLALLENTGARVDAYLDVLGVRSAGEIAGWARFWGVVLGSTLGMVLADAVAILVGRSLGKRLPERVLKRVSGYTFVAFGALTLAVAFLGR